MERLEFPDKLRRDLHELVGACQNTRPVSSRLTSNYRQEEPAAIWKASRENPIIAISGTAGEGKTTTLCQLLRAHPDELTTLNMHSVLSSDAGVITEDNEIYASHNDLLNYLISHQYTLAVDEMTETLESPSAQMQYRRYLNFFRDCLSNGIKVIGVIHHYPEAFTAADRLFGLQPSQIIYPRQLTLAEIGTGTNSGPYQKSGQEPYQPEVLTYDPRTAETVMRIAGTTPLLVNNLLSLIYRELAMDSKFTGHINPELIENLYAKFFKARLSENNNYLRVFSLALNEYKIDSTLIEKYLKIFSEESPHYSDIDSGTLMNWERLHLVRRGEDNNYLVNGQATLDFVSKMFPALTSTQH